MATEKMNMWFLEKLQCPISGKNLKVEENRLVSEDGVHSYNITNSGILSFTKNCCSEAAQRQEILYDRIASQYLKSWSSIDTYEYTKYLDNLLLESTNGVKLDDVVEICCGNGEMLKLLGDRIQHGIGIDISLLMLESAKRDLASEKYCFIQADATILPLKENQFDAVFMLGGIHHIVDREKLFSKIYKMLKPGCNFYWREPVSDNILWKSLRYIIYRLSTSLDYKTEHPLEYKKTKEQMESCGLKLKLWHMCGFLGFFLFMNSNILVVNRLFRFLPGIRSFVKIMTKIDEYILKLKNLSNLGCLVIGVAQKPCQFNLGDLNDK